MSMKVGYEKLISDLKEQIIEKISGEPKMFCTHHDLYRWWETQRYR